MRNLSFSDRLKLGVMPGTQGAFDTNTGDDYSHSLSYGGTDDSWKLFCEEGSEHGIETDDYDSEEEYEEVLSEAKESEENTEITLSFFGELPGTRQG